MIYFKRQLTKNKQTRIYLLLIIVTDVRCRRVKSGVQMLARSMIVECKSDCFQNDNMNIKTRMQRIALSFPELSLQQLTSINILDFVHTALHTPFMVEAASPANSAAAFIWSLTTSTLLLAHFRSAYSSNAVRTPTTITLLPAFATNRLTIAR